jgi:hypothetical protein
MGPAGCPETSVRNHHYSLHNNPREGSSYLLRDGSFKITHETENFHMTVSFSVRFQDKFPIILLFVAIFVYCRMYTAFALVVLNTLRGISNSELDEF